MTSLLRQTNGVIVDVQGLLQQDRHTSRDLSAVMSIRLVAPPPTRLPGRPCCGLVEPGIPFEVQHKDSMSSVHCACSHLSRVQQYPAQATCRAALLPVTCHQPYRHAGTTGEQHVSSSLQPEGVNQMQERGPGACVCARP